MPYNEVLKCNISYDQFDRTLEDGDDLTIHAVIELGGYRDLWNGSHIHQRQMFHRSKAQTSISFLFDFTKPKHCSDFHNCTSSSEVPLDTPNDASKNAFKFDAGGWSDIPSGIQKYFLEVHHLQKRLHANTLTEMAPMNPFFREERNESSLPFPEFTPPGPGVYSVVLQVTDKANNSEFARQIVIYDPNSTITNSAETNFYVPSAEKESNYRWQSRCQTVQVSWRDYFENSFQVANHFLLPVEDFPTQFRGGDVEEVKDEIVKKVTRFYDDHDGKRTVSGVTHANGITEFELLYTYISYTSPDIVTSVENNINTETTTETLSTDSFNTTINLNEDNSTAMFSTENFTSELTSIANENSTVPVNELSNNTATDTNTSLSLSKIMTSFTVPSTKVMTSYAVPSSDVMTSFTVPSTGQMTTASPCLSIANRTNLENQWIKIENLSESSFVLEHAWNDGDSINISVRARDTVNNTMVASRLVSFDSSPPNSSEAIFTKNTGNKAYRFSSSVSIRAWDEHSGIRHVQWRLKDKHRPQEWHEEGYFLNEPLKMSDCANSKDCYCIPKGECFKKDMLFDFNNCLLAIDRSRLSNATLILEFEAFNQAMLSSNITSYELNHLTSFEGIDDSAGIKNLQSKDLGNGIRLTWDIVPSCYKVSDISVFLYTDCDKSNPPKEIPLPTDRTELELTNLESGREFCIEVISNSTGDPQAFVDRLTFKTSPAIPIVMIVAVSAVMAILLGLVVVFMILWRTGRVKPETKRRLTMYLKRPVTMFQSSRKSGFYSGRFQDEDIYDFGKMVFTANEGWLFGFDDIDLKGKLKSGDFADIYLAKICKKDMAVAKILKEDHTEEDRLVLKAKISFFATEVPSDDNIIQFLGSVLNHPLFGPYMLMEYCELGQMREWLIDNRNKVNDDLITDFCKMVLGIAKGMETLSIKGIVHKRLATRNILLTSRLVPKVAGFGPTPEEGENEVDQKRGKERKPMRWLAPECYESMKLCTSMSGVWAFGVVIWETFSTG
uniref:Uncharacterized protein LOC111120331 n=1 Tax=Crassostrea virginica TaxID=6565 RepID=A0A8B8CLN3_CRAVI|nr:uncharacterized protein LOC111120331 [Crassostrea virginica]